MARPPAFPRHFLHRTGVAHLLRNPIVIVPILVCFLAYLIRAIVPTRGLPRRYQAWALWSQRCRCHSCPSPPTSLKGDGTPRGPTALSYSLPRWSLIFSNHQSHESAESFRVLSDLRPIFTPFSELSNFAQSAVKPFVASPGSTVSVRSSSASLAKSASATCKLRRLNPLFFEGRLVDFS